MKTRICPAAVGLLIPASAIAQSAAHPYAQRQQIVIQSTSAVAGAAKNLSDAIAGTVVDAVTGNPVPRAELTLQIKADEGSATADSGGKFLFDHLEPGKYQLYARAPGYSAQGLNQHGAFFTGVVVGNALDSEHIVFRLHPQAVIFGKVTDERGEAVRNASVQIFSKNKNNSQRSLASQSQTNDLGEYRFAGLLPGKYFVVVSAQPWYAQPAFRFVHELPDNLHATVIDFGRDRPGKPDPALDVVYAITFYPGVTDERSATELNLHEGETQQADIPLRAVPSVHIRLANLPTDQAAPDISAYQKILASTEFGVPMHIAQISPGEVEIAGLPPGQITFAFHSRSEPGQIPSTFEANLSGDATLDASKTPALSPVSGRVILSDGLGEIGDAGIRLMPQTEPTQVPVTRLRKDGTFSFQGVPPGNYGLFVNLPGPPRYVQKIIASGAKIEGRRVLITGTSDVQLTIIVAAGVGQIEGVAMLGKNPADGVLVLLLPDSGADIDSDLRMDQSDSDGSFTLAYVTPGKYRLLAIQDGWDLDYRNPAVIKPCLAKAQSLQIAPNDVKNLTVEVQPLLK